MHRKKILFIVFGLPYGGTTTSLLNLITVLKGRYDIEILSFWNEQNPLSNEIKNMVTVRHLSLNKQAIDRLPFGLRGLVRILNQFWWRYVVSHPKILMTIYNSLKFEKYDYEIGYTETSDVIEFLRYRRSNSIKYQWIHTDIFLNNETKSIQKNLETLVNIDRYICVSRVISNKMRKVYSNRKIDTIHNVICKDPIIRKSKEYEVEFLDENEIHLISIGRISEIKGYDRLVKVHKRLVSEGYFHYIHIIGNDQGYKDSLEKIIVSLGVEKTFLLEGEKSNPYPFFKKASGLVISSYSEGLPTVAIEAQVLECPVISTNVGGIGEIIDDQAGIIVDNSETGLYDGLLQFIKTKDKEYIFDSSNFTSVDQIEKIFSEGE